MWCWLIAPLRRVEQKWLIIFPGCLGSGESLDHSSMGAGWPSLRSFEAVLRWSKMLIVEFSDSSIAGERGLSSKWVL